MSKEQHNLIIKIHVYRISAIIFAILGLLVFVILYDRLAAGDFMRIIKNPMLVGWLILPFAPASFLFWRTGNCEKKLMAMLEQKNNSS